MAHMSRAGRKAQILETLQARWCAYSTHGLARAIGMKPSPHFRSIVYEMWQAGLIGGWGDCLPNGRGVFYWYDLERDQRWGQSSLPGFGGEHATQN